jgi:hypothetical protein
MKYIDPGRLMLFKELVDLEELLWLIIIHLLTRIGPERLMLAC